MGRSTASCLKIIACGSGSVDHDDLRTTEGGKGSNDFQCWSFRKKSARNRILSNSATAETPSSFHKENLESNAVDSKVQPDLTAAEKASVVHLTEVKNELSAQPDKKLSENIVDKEDDNGSDETHDEPSTIVIQTGIRGSLARQVLSKIKYIIKVQAVTRGHLVRRHATGTLRCIQAIIKMQALVRAHHTHQLVEESCDFGKQSECSEKSKKGAKCTGPYTCVSIEKLMSNTFARQLMESPSKTKPINIKCEPSKSDSAWKWLERWTRFSSITIEEPQDSESAAELHKEDSQHSNGKTDFHSGADASPKLSENDDDVMSNDATRPPLSRYEVTESITIETKEADLVETMKMNSLPEELHEQDGPDSKKISSEQPEPEAKTFSKKASNSPAFIAAKSKFEELTSSASSAKLTGITRSSIHDHQMESSLDEVSSSTEQFRSRDFGLADNSISNSAAQTGGSDCGTELSITSTLDSPEKSDAEDDCMEQETKVLDETADHLECRESLGDANEKSMILETDPSFTNSDKLERDENTNSATGESLYPTIAHSPEAEKRPEATTSDLQQLVSEVSNPVNSSPQPSPRNNLTVTESQATTPPSKVSIKRKKNQVKKSDSSPKDKSAASTNKKSPPNRKQDSVSRINLDRLQEHKTEKRNSLGSAQPENKDQEPRDSTSSNSLPSYMQATQSAKAKAITNGSPRSSPDVHDKNIHIKKRQSVTGSNEKQGSPHIHRTLSSAQQNEKGNGVHSPQEKKWKR